MDPRLPSWLAAPARQAWALAAVLLLATAATYGNALDGGFVWDDEQVVVGPATREGARGLPRLLLSPDEVKPYYRPLTRASYVLDHAAWGLEPRGYHAVNVALHAASVLLLFLLALRLLGAPAPAFLAALLHAVHPVNAEAVAFLSARNNLLALGFALATLLLFLEALRRRKAWPAWLSGAAFLLGLASKEPALMVAPLLPALLFRRGAWREEGPRSLRLLAPHALALAAYAGLRWAVVGGAVSATSPLDGLPGRLAATALIVPRYLALLLWPAGLTTFHRDPVATPGSLAWAAVAWTGLAAGVALLLRRPSPASSLGLAWAGLNFLPIANLVPIPSTAMAERFLYLVVPGVWLVAADASVRLQRAFPRTAALQAAAWALALALLTGRTVVRNRDWHDDVSLARSALAVDPRSPTALYNLGVALKDRGDLDGAARAWTAALEADPGSAEALTQLGTLAALRGDPAAAERAWRDALARKDVAGAHFNLAVLCERTGRPAEALAHYQAFLRTAGPTDQELIPRAQDRVAALRPGSSP